MMLTHHGALNKLKLFHLEDGGFNHQRDYKTGMKNNDIRNLGAKIKLISICLHILFIIITSIVNFYLFFIKNLFLKGQCIMKL